MPKKPATNLLSGKMCKNREERRKTRRRRRRGRRGRIRGRITDYWHLGQRQMEWSTRTELGIGQFKWHQICRYNILNRSIHVLSTATASTYKCYGFCSWHDPFQMCSPHTHSIVSEITHRTSQKPKTKNIVDVVARIRTTAFSSSQTSVMQNRDMALRFIFSLQHKPYFFEWNLNVSRAASHLALGLLVPQYPPAALPHASFTWIAISFYRILFVFLTSLPLSSMIWMLKWRGTRVAVDRKRQNDLLHKILQNISPFYKSMAVAVAAAAAQPQQPDSVKVFRITGARKPATITKWRSSIPDGW